MAPVVLEINMEDLTLQQETFCRFYTQNEELFGNGTLAYAEAYGYDFEALSNEPQKNEKNEVIPLSSERERAYANCSSAASRLLRNVKIQARITALLNELLKDDVVDAQLVRVIMQDRKLDSKIAAIREYNKLKQRIIEKTDITTQGDKIGSNILPEVIAEADRLLKEKKLNG